MATRVGAPAGYDQLTPGNKTKWLVNCTAPSLLLDAFIQKGRDLNLLRATQGPLRSATSGIRSYANFCTSRDRPWFPLTETTVKEWSTTFNHGRTFQMYLRHLGKRILFTRPTNKLDDARGQDHRDWHIKRTGQVLSVSKLYPIKRHHRNIEACQTRQ